ncbi:MAG: DNA polymerase IV, partial [Nocardioidaceae bacterium]|nr:DNA polymerase IV [Nocardioidaceae bacterium]
ETKSVSVEDTFETDLVDPALLKAVVDGMSRRVAERLARERLSGRTVTLKVRRHDFSTHTRSATLAGPTDDRREISRLAVRLLGQLDTSGGVRLLGVGVAGLADWIQDDLFATARETASPSPSPELEPGGEPPPVDATAPRWSPGCDVVHAVLGPGWVWGAGLGRVTVRFETATTPSGPVRTFAADDSALSAVGEPGPIPSAP